MLKEAVAIAGGAVLLPPLGIAAVACGLPGILVAGAGLYLAKRAFEQLPSTGGRPAGKPDESLEGRLSDPFTAPPGSWPD
jgi:hypothetical protein